MIAPPPGSTLFPYTTLFRSCVPRLLVHAARRDEAAHDSAMKRFVGFLASSARLRSGCSQPATNELRTAPANVPSADRKSTRLNSSHQIISYAVFCLKKKNTY